MPAFQSMNSAALVAAVLGPAGPPSEHYRGLPPQKRQRHTSAEVAASSSALTELSDRDFSTQTDKRTSRVAKGTAAETSKPGKRIRSSDTDIEEIASHCKLKVVKSSPEARSLNQSRITHIIESDNDDNDMELPDCNTVRPRAKVAARRLVRKKPHGMRVPQTLEDAGPGDRMMWEWRNQGKSWEQVRNEWQRITGIRPGTSTLSVRYLKLNENFARHGAAGERELLRFKREVDEELDDQIWERVAQKMLAFSELSEHNPRELKKRYDYIVRSGMTEDRLDEQEEQEEQEQEVEIVASGVEVKLESEEEPRKSKVVTLPLTKKSNKYLNDSVCGSIFYPSSSGGPSSSGVLETSDIREPGFTAPFAYNYMTPTSDRMRSTDLVVGRLPAENMTAETATPEKRKGAPSPRPLPLGARNTYQAPVSRPHSRVTSSSPLLMSSSPFFKTLVTYDSDDE